MSRGCIKKAIQKIKKKAIKKILMKIKFRFKQ